MPRLARHQLMWSEADQRYELREREGVTSYLLLEEGEGWRCWLAEHASFSFQGQRGHLNLLKEARARGSDYWYAYRSVNRRTSKRYAGRTADLTVAHLEELAAAFNDQATDPAPTTEGALAVQSQRDLLLETKLRLPRVPGSLVAREHLWTRLDAGLTCKLTLLCAPAGFGKTTLASQWLDARRTIHQVPPTGWVALDSGDNDPNRFWRYVIAACQNFHIHLPLAQISAGLSPLLEPPSLEKILTLMLNELSRSACSGLLVLEDYHLITEARIHETMTFFLEHLPESIHVMLLSRHEPPFPLVRWRARGELCEVQAADLRFSLEETEHFFRQKQIVSSEDLQQLHTRVEGWAAGLRMLALALHGRASYQTLAVFLDQFSGNQRSLQEYFVLEVLQGQTDEIQDFLLRSSILDRLSGALCAAVVEQHDSVRILEQIERAGLFLEALSGSGEWYRYHTLFAEAMRAEAKRRLGMNAWYALYQRASIWYEQEGMLTEAIEAAFQAQDIQRAVLLIERLFDQPVNFLLNMQPLQPVSEFYTLRRWLERIPESMFRTRPLLCFGYVIAMVLVPHQEQLSISPASLKQLFDILQLAEECWRREGNLARLGELYTFRALILRQPAAIREAMGYARQALELLPESSREARGMVLWMIGIGEMQEGNLEAARKVFLQVRAICEAMGAPAILRACTVWLSSLYLALGELHQAEASFRQLLSDAREAEDIDDVCDALLGLAQIAYTWNELAVAEERAQEGLSLALQMANEELQVQATLMLARIELAHGDITMAQQRCSELMIRLSTVLPQYSRLIREIQAMQAQLALFQGDLAAVERWHKRLESEDEVPLILREQENLLWARWQLACGQAQEALTCLVECGEKAQQAGCTLRLWECQLLQVLALNALKHSAQARTLLKEVLERVYIEAPLRLLLDEGEVLATLAQSLASSIHNERQRTFLRHLLLAFAQQRIGNSQTPLPEPLSAQEQRVLRLLASGRSNPEIARDLVVSINTVKAHIQSIYRKLNASNRVEASQVARLLKLI